MEVSFEQARSKVSHTFRNRRLPTYGKKSTVQPEKRQRNAIKKTAVAKRRVKRCEGEQDQPSASWFPTCLTGEAKPAAVGGAWMDSSKRPRMI